jgi:hypothetical protein
VHSFCRINPLYSNKKSMPEEEEETLEDDDAYCLVQNCS